MKKPSADEKEHCSYSCHISNPRKLEKYKRTFAEMGNGWDMPRVTKREIMSARRWI